MVVLIKTLQVILAMSLLIFIHELGHYMWARIFGIKVEKFYLFFDVGGKALFRFKKGDTEFGIGWLPFGGYCKIAGMIDESLDKSRMGKEPEEWEFRSKPAWQRLLVLFGGVLNNFIFAILAYIVIIFAWGEAYIDNKGSKIYPNELAVEMGFRSGDEILKMDNYVPDNFGMLQADLVRREVRMVDVLRGADTVGLYIDGAMTGKILNSPLLFDLAVPFTVDSLIADGANADCGLRKGDHIVRVAGKPVEYVQDARPVLSSLAGGEAAIDFTRGSDTLSATVKVDSLGRIGIALPRPNVVLKKYSFLESIPAGVRMTGETIGGYLKDLKMIATPSTGAYKSVGSFIAIGQIMPASWDWWQFLTILALLSIVLGVMNLIPIPGLDGGHIVFTLVEMITGHKPSERFMYVMQIIGMILIFMLMFLAFGNDIGRLLH